MRSSWTLAASAADRTRVSRSCSHASQECPKSTALSSSKTCALSLCSAALVSGSESYVNIFMSDSETDESVSDDSASLALLFLSLLSLGAAREEESADGALVLEEKGEDLVENTVVGMRLR